MKKKSILLFFILVSAISVYLRFLQLKNEFEVDTGLAVANGKIGSALFIVAAGTLIIFGLWVGLMKNRPGSMAASHAAEPYSGDLWATADICAAFIILLSGLSGMLQFFDNRLISSLVLALLAVFASACMILYVFARKHGTLGETDRILYLVVPVFWSAFYVVLTFKGSTANPVLPAYVLELLSALLIMLGLYFHALHDIAGRRGYAFLWTALSGSYCIIVSEGGRILQALSGDISALVSQLPTIFSLLGALIYLLNHWNIMIRKLESR